MLTNVLAKWFLLFSVFVIPINAIVKCTGSELSVYSDDNVGTLTEKQCTFVFGDIVIANLKHGKRMPCYWSILDIQGSIIIENTTNLGDSVNFQNLRTISATEKAALIIRNNKGLKLAIGARLEKVLTTGRTTYLFQNNWPAFMTESQHYTLYSAAAVERPVFITDNFYSTRPCNSNTFIALVWVFTGLNVLLVVFLFWYAIYGRPLSKNKIE